MLLLPYKSIYPTIGTDVFLAPHTTILGDVIVGNRSSIWYGCTIRGDVHSVRIGEFTNVQDNSVLHVTRERFPLTIGSYVTIGHAAMLHGCVLEDECFIGMSATVLDGAIIEKHGMVAAGALVPPGMRVKSNEIVAGVPAVFLRKQTPQEIEDIRASALRYAAFAMEHKTINTSSTSEPPAPNR